MILKTGQVNVQPTFRKKLKKFLSSKLVVCLAIVGLTLGVFTIVQRSNADDENIDFSRVYQYYLLSNSNGQDNTQRRKQAQEKQQSGSQDNKDKKDDSSKSDSSSSSDSKSDDKDGKAVAGEQDQDSDDGLTDKLVGLLGNGGNQGSFSYDDIVQGSANKPAARQFSEVMATLSGYNYISVQNNGMDKIIQIVVHFLVGVPLVIIGFFTDVLSLFWTAIVNVIAQYNVFNLIGAAFGQSKAGDKLAEALKISPDSIKDIVSMGMWIFTAVMIFTVVWALRNGGTKVSNRDKHKVIGRAMGLIGIPIVISMSCAILSDITELSVGTNPSTDPTYAGWLMDVESWAKKYNFDITEGGINKSISADFDNSKDQDNYVDSNFNPYLSSQPADKIGRQLYQDGLGASKTKFPNSTIAMSYLSSQTFSSRDYLDYIANHDINTLAGSSFPDSNLYDFDTAYDSNGTSHKEDSSTGAGWPAPKGMSVAAGDYGDKDDPASDHKATSVQTWEDRYIFGAKNTGMLSKYYKEQPSMEQVYSQRGGRGSNADNRLTDESTFLALSTKFNSEGGNFSIDGPTYGAYATISKFDSNRYAYYKYSMVGNPIFTIPAITVNGLLSILIGAATIVALWSVGIVDMNLKPLRSWIKAVSFGDIEYTEATMVYALGIAATGLTVTIIPPLLVNAFTAIADMIGKLLTGDPSTANSGGMTVAASEMIGTSYWIGFAFAVFGLIAFFKNYNGFRDKLVHLMLIPWEWASAKGEELESFVGENNRLLKEGRKRAQDKIDNRRKRANDFLEDLSRDKTGLGKGINTLTGGKAGDLADKALMSRAQSGDYSLETRPDGLHTEKELTIGEIKRRGNIRRMGEALNSLGADTKAPGAIAKDFDEHATPEDGLSEGNLVDNDGKFNPNNDYITDDSRKDMNDLNHAMDGLSDQNAKQGLLTLAGANGLTPEEMQTLNNLHKVEDDTLGKKGAEDYRDLQHKIAQGKRLTPEEQKRLNDYNKKLAAVQGVIAARALGNPAYQDYKRLQAKAASGRRLTPQEQRRLNFYRSQIQHAQDQHAETVLGKKDYQDYENLQNKVANGGTLTPEEQQRLDKYNQKLQANPLDEKQALGLTPYQDYQALQQKVADGQKLSPEEQSRYDRYQKDMKLNGVGPDGLQTMAALERKAAPTLSDRETNELNNLQQKAGNILGEDGLYDYQELQQKVVSGQKLSPNEQKRLDGYHQKLQEGGMAPSLVKRYEDLQSKGQNGLTVKQNHDYKELMKEGAQAPGMSPAAMQNFAALSQKERNHTLTPEERKQLDNYLKKLQKTMKPKDVKRLQRLAGKKVVGHLNTKELQHLKVLQDKNGFETRGAVALSASQQQRLTTLRMSREDAVRQQAPTIAAKLNKYENMRGMLTKPQMAEYRQLRTQAQSIGDKALKPEELKEYKRLNGLMHPTMKNGMSSRMTPGEKKQYNALQAKALQNLDKANKERANRIANQINNQSRKVAEKKDQIISKVQDPNNIHSAKVERVQTARNNEAQLANVQRAYSNFATRGGTPNDANKLVASMKELVNSTANNPQQRDKTLKTVRTVSSQLRTFDFAPRGSVDTNGDGKVNIGDAGVGLSGNQESKNETLKFKQNLDDLDFELDKLDHAKPLHSQTRFGK